ncbi:hypothetical protein BH11BAC5_BH11BAC5_08560 [soil metagenome]
MRIPRIILLLFIGLIVTVLFRCNSSGFKNYKNAEVEKDNGRLIVKLRGRRKLMVHDPVSLFLNKTYEDSFSFSISQLTDCTIEGKDIPVEEGYYRYKGQITITKNKLHVNLLIDNTDDKMLAPDSWNGDYNLIEK